MSRYDYEGPAEYQPLSGWDYVGYTLLFAIPLVGLIFLLVFSFSDKNINRRSYARSYWCWLLLLTLLGLLYIVIAGLFTTLLPFAFLE